MIISLLCTKQYTKNRNTNSVRHLRDITWTWNKSSRLFISPHFFLLVTVLHRHAVFFHSKARHVRC